MQSNPTVKQREQAARELLATLQLHGKRVGVRLAEIFEPLLETGEELPDVVLLQQLMAREIRAGLTDLLAADQALLAVLEQIGEEPGDDGELARGTRDLFLYARRAKTESEQQQAMAAFDETYAEIRDLVEALYLLAGEDEIAARLRPPAGDDAPPEPQLARAEIPEPPDEGDGEDQIQRRILSRKARHPGLARWLGTRIFRRDRFKRP